MATAEAELLLSVIAVARRVGVEGGVATAEGSSDMHDEVANKPPNKKAFG